MYEGNWKCERMEGRGIEPFPSKVSSCILAGVTGGDVFRRDGEGLLGRP